MQYWHLLKIVRQHGEPLSRVPHVPACSCNIKMLAHNDCSKAGDQSGLWIGAYVLTLPSLAGEAGTDYQTGGDRKDLWGPDPSSRGVSGVSSYPHL